MDITNNNYCIILAGGRGRRLWPSSRQERPKQFIDFFGTGRTQLQATFDRINRIVPREHVFVSTCREYEKVVREQLPEVLPTHVLCEPVIRNTAPSVAWASVCICRECSEARVVILPSDQLVTDDDAFCRNVEDALRFVGENDLLLTMGVGPSRPEPGYGYIQMGEASLSGNIFKVKSFTEKPEREFAQMFMSSGEFLWNTGMFLSNVRNLLSFFHQAISDMPHRLSSLLEMTDEEAMRTYVERYYPAYPNLSMDMAVLERSGSVYVMRCDFGWADLGTWHSVYEYERKEEGDNVVIDSEVLLEDCRNNVIKLPKGHVGVINGLDGYIVAEEGDVLLICKKGDSSALIRKYVNEVGIRFGESFT